MLLLMLYQDASKGSAAKKMVVISGCNLRHCWKKKWSGMRKVIWDEGNDMKMVTIFSAHENDISD